ncbi:MAG: hypothetical protein IJR14_09610 [Synergistaceae bacterium]|nr:hypothetical protein [Synergistaceae bacterium]
MPEQRQRIFPWLLISCAVSLMVAIFWFVGASSVKPTQGLMISNVSVSVGIEDRPFLAGTVSRFRHGARQVCIRFDYDRLQDSEQIDVLWDWGEKRVQEERYALPAPSGTRMYCLLKEDGSPLPMGPYTVTIQRGDEILPQFHFEIY